jgi:hypothetical protein
MAETLSLMEFLQALLADADLRGDFGDDPQGTLSAHGLADLTPADVHDALVLVQDNQTVDYSLDAVASAPPPPPPTGDHEAAVEYLARYLAGPQQAGPDELWPDPDAAPASPAVPDGAPFGTFDTGDDAWYGAGSGSSADDDAWAVDPEGIGPEADRGTADGYDPGGYDALSDYDDLGNLAEFDDFPGGELSDGDLDGPGRGDDGTALTAGA